eukprot:5561236-Prymnesium_polylepis.1
MSVACGEQHWRPLEPIAGVGIGLLLPHAQHLDHLLEVARGCSVVDASRHGGVANTRHAGGVRLRYVQRHAPTQAGGRLAAH